MSKVTEKISASTESLKDSMTEALIRLCSIPAVSPHNGGTGEDAKILELAKIIDELGLKNISLKVEYVEDGKAPSGRRPSLFLECELFGGNKDDIKVIGIRHGEKLYETLLTNEE
ncbi:MAG: polysaccharide biosynthesis protein, partial [Synergistaceae bacterium]|nr:polysaccharide biosynthesis protein [Synergistaceae bacterium]